MAKYEDYVKANEGGDNLSREIEDSQARSEQRQEEGKDFAIPERFKGKSAEEIARSYVELEKHSSRRESELDRVRRLADELIQAQSAALTSGGESDSTEKEEPLSFDDLYDNPEEAISKVADKSVRPKLQELEGEISKYKRKNAEQELNEMFPNWRTDVQDPAFKEFVEASQFRQTLAQQADQYDLEAAKELFELYYSITGKSRDGGRKQAQRRSRDLQDAASLESGGPSATDDGPTFSRRDLLEARIAAKHGDQKARRWLQENANAISAAYENDRVTD